MNKRHAASQADRRSGFRDAGAERTTTDREGERGSLESRTLYTVSCVFSSMSAPAVWSTVDQLLNNQILRVYIYYLALVELQRRHVTGFATLTVCLCSRHWFSLWQSCKSNGVSVRSFISSTSPDVTFMVNILFVKGVVLFCSKRSVINGASVPLMSFSV